jgi:hypothetical protein
MPIADQIAALLNEMLAADPAATHALIANRVPCNDTLRDHPTIQVHVRNASGIFPTVGMLGVLNGVAGTVRRVVAVFDDDTHCLVRFEAQDLAE